MASIHGAVMQEPGGIELLARYSLSSLRLTSGLNSIEEFRERQRSSVTDKDWNWRILRDQFMQKNMEDLYIRYDDKLRLSYLTMFLILEVVFSITHILVLALTAGVTNPQQYIAIICYALQAVLPILILFMVFKENVTKKYPWINAVTSVAVLCVLVITDIVVVSISYANYSPLRPAYAVHTLLACYVFLPIRNNYLTIGLGTLVSVCHLILLGVVTYRKDHFIYYKLGAELLYFIGINFVGVYYRLMNEIVTRRSFLDRRACVEANFRLNFEKEQEERLMLSILPEHIASVLRQDFRAICTKIQSGRDEPISNTFKHSYIDEHKDVSILYADVVNYTMITTTLEPKQLIETLNELFGRFDEASEEHDVLRIKFLGDCYYCVAGVPKPNPQHAKSCVLLGFDMINIISDVRQRRDLNIDMRIGIHTGNIMSGLVGIRKWQYDIWSRDVTIANRMESTGKPGKVHITKRTLEELRESARDYIIEPNYEAMNDPLLAKYKIETYLLTQPNRNSEQASEYSVPYMRAPVARSMAAGTKTNTRLSENSALNTVRRRTTFFIDNNLMAYRQMLQAADKQMATVIDEMPTGLIHKYVNRNEIHPFTLLYRNTSWEKQYILEPDPLFKYFIGSSLLILILIIGIEFLTLDHIGWRALVIEGTLLLTLIVLQPFHWTHFLWSKYRGSVRPENRLIEFFYDKSFAIVMSALARNILYVFVSFVLMAGALLNLINCTYYRCLPGWHLDHAFALAVLVSFLFNRVFFILKWSLGILFTGLYIWIVWDLRNEIFENQTTWNLYLDSSIVHTLSIVFLTFCLHWTDRQTEYRNRLDHRMKIQLTEEQEEAWTMKNINNMLLNNILPEHVAYLYLDTQRPPEELYHEEYRCVSVMFASLTDTKLGSDDDEEISQKLMLKILHQLITDFDKLLLGDNKKSLKVEKIKMAGWTYMAACGLEPGPRESGESEETYNHDGPLQYSENRYEDDVVITMLEFAALMMNQLQNFNKSAFQSFQGTNLKIGISHGPITAGVVGSLKPLYDIWGNAVNMASRMDSTGEAGRIQVTENTAKVLDRQGVLTQYRGMTYVKGKGEISTYFVPLDSEFNILYKRRETRVLLSNNAVVTRF